MLFSKKIIRFKQTLNLKKTGSWVSDQDPKKNLNSEIMDNFGIQKIMGPKN